MYKNTLYFNPAEWRGEKNNQPSETIPDPAMTIQEMLDRFASGRPVGGARKDLDELDHDDTDDELNLNLPDFSKMDKTERLDAYREIKAAHASLEAQIKADRKKQKDADREAARQTAADKAAKEAEILAYLRNKNKSAEGADTNNP